MRPDVRSRFVSGGRLLVKWGVGVEKVTMI
jgi:hypothetical protein